MNILSDVILFIASLAVNSFLFGLVVAGGIAVAFRLIRNSCPRLRYTLAVAAFVIAAFVPLAVTLRAAYEPQSPPLALTSTQEDLSGSLSFDDKQATELRSDSASQDQTLRSARTNLLNDLALYVGGSWLGTLFSGIWIFVSIQLLVREITGYRRLRNERKRWRLANAEQRERFLCPETITLYFADEGFFTTGFFSPAIVLPHHFPKTLSRFSIRGIVLHEIAHARWRDAFVNSLLRVVRGLFWINPALWLLDRTIRAEREAAADRSALVALSHSGEAEEANTDYATAIISIAKLSAAASSPQKTRLAAMYFGEGTKLEDRIHRILNARSQPKRLRVAFGFAVFLTSVLAFTIIPVASVPLTKVQAEIAPVGFNESSKLNVSDFSPEDYQGGSPNDESIKGNSVGRAPDKVDKGNTTSGKPENETIKDQDRKITSTPTVVEKIEVKVPGPRTQTTSSAPNPELKVVYQWDSAKPIILPILNINPDVRPEVVRQDLNVVFSPKQVVRVVVQRPFILVDYTK